MSISELILIIVLGMQDIVVNKFVTYNEDYLF